MIISKNGEVQLTYRRSEKSELKADLSLIARALIEDGILSKEEIRECIEDGFMTDEELMNKAIDLFKEVLSKGV